MSPLTGVRLEQKTTVTNINEQKTTVTQHQRISTLQGTSGSALFPHKAESGGPDGKFILQLLDKEEAILGLEGYCPDGPDGGELNGSLIATWAADWNPND